MSIPLIGPLFFALALAITGEISFAGEPTTVGDMKVCFPNDYDLGHDKPKAEIIKKIIDYVNCIKTKEHARVGKWFCYVSKMAGIQTEDDGRDSSGLIHPKVEKFFVTISEISDNDKEMSCDWGEYGINGNMGEDSSRCLSNYKLTISPDVYIVWNESVDSYSFHEHFGNSFFLYEAHDSTAPFVFVHNPDYHHTYVSHGECEKIN
jgi:hypothetical protein